MRMRRVFTSTGLAALMAFFVWSTIIFARTSAFTALSNDPQRTFAILGSAVAMAVFGGCINRIINSRDDDE